MTAPAIRKFALILSALALCVAGLSAQAQQAGDELDEFLEVTGFDVALESMREGAMDATAILGLDAADFGPAWPALVNRVFAKSVLHKSARELLGPTLSDEMRDAAITFYRSDLGARLVAVENAAHSGKDETETERGEALVAEMVQSGSDRLAILKRMNHAIDPENIGVEAVQNVQIGFLLAASDAGVINRIDEAVLRSLMKEQLAEMSVEIEKASLASSAAVYESFTTDELEAYAAALEAPLMKRVYELMNGVQFAIMERRYRMLGAQMSGLSAGEEL